MKRLGAVAFFAGAVLLSTHILAPAEPPAAPAGVLAADLAARHDAPLLAQVDARVQRLRERLRDRPPPPRPTRDPFRFGSRSPAPAAEHRAPADPPAVPDPTLPRVIAIATGAADSPTGAIAVLASGDTVAAVKPGERFLTFRVDRVGAERVDLSDPQTGRTFQISLR